MKTVNLMDNFNRVQVIVEDDKTIREIFESNGFDTTYGRPYCSGTPVDFDDVIGDITDNDTVSLSLAVNTKNAAKVRNIGSACYIISDMTPEQYADAKKYAPEKLKLKDEKGNEVFAVTFAEGEPQLKSAYAQFSEEYEGKLAMPIIATKTELIDSRYKQLLNLNEVEAQVANNAANVQAAKGLVEAMFI